MSSLDSSIDFFLQTGKSRLVAADVESPALESRLLLGHVLGQNSSWLLAHSDEHLNPVLAEQFLRCIARRVEGEPIAYLVGHREFWSLNFELGPSCLIPRFETEILVERALHRLPKKNARVMDLGTGAGVIVMALKTERPDIEAWGVDCSEEALYWARRNAKALGVDIHWFCGDWLAAVASQAQWDLMVSNPPYISADDPCLTIGDLRHEPRRALVAGAQGLDALQYIAWSAWTYLKPGGWLVLEHGWKQGAAVRGLLIDRGYDLVKTWQDLSGHERVTEGIKPGGD